MDKRKKVVWNEGMYLEPHHFQQGDRFLQSVVSFRIRSVCAFDWGWLELAIDKEALANGQFVLLKGKGVASDGLVFDIPDEDEAPAARDFREVFPATENVLPAYLVIPIEQENGQNIQLDSEARARETRYRVKKISIPDENSGRDEREINVAMGNFQYHFGRNSLQGRSAIKITEIVRSPDGTFLASDRYIPTCLCLQASENLKSLTRRLLELLVAKSISLAGSQSSIRKRECSPYDLIIIGLVQIFSAYIPLLNHAFSLSRMHPEELYLILLSLAGELSAYSTDPSVQARDFPVYNHDNLTDCFSSMEKRIEFLLENVTPESRYANVPLERKSESLYIGRIPDPTWFEKMKLFIVASGEIPGRKLASEIPLNFRVASPDTINSVLGSFGRALSINYSPAPPPGLPRSEGALFFEMKPGGPFWDAIRRNCSLAIFVPAELSSLKIEVLAV